MVSELLPHQREALHTAVHALELPVHQAVPEHRLRTQMIMADGFKKSLVAGRSPEKLLAGRVLMLVPSPDLLAQTDGAWREGARRGPMRPVSSLRGREA
ncbi:hypothetical protein [Streptomyces sp. NPDC051546]|uniref:hypothetical protein n=1 Tax=Streptomyces sp. NPDC051546 TaxID=3365655 RepID=UPI0037B5E162